MRQAPLRDGRGRAQQTANANNAMPAGSGTGLIAAVKPDPAVTHRSTSVQLVPVRLTRWTSVWADILMPWNMPLRASRLGAFSIATSW